MRLVAHALWSTSHERVLVWAESAARWPGKVFDNTDARGARAHPFAAPFPVLRQILGASDEVTLTAAVLLPSDLARPLPSPWLGCDAPSGVRRVAPWAVPALSISPAALAEGLSDEVACADSVSFVVQVAAFGAQLVRAGAVVPSLSGRAVGWEPLLGLAAASQRLQVLAEAMPPSVAVVLSPERLREHAASGLPWSQAPRPSAEDVVSGMVREALLVGELPPQIRRHLYQSGIVLEWDALPRGRCSCGAWPCAHACAVVYRLSSVAYQEPQSLLPLYGCDLEAFAEILRDSVSAQPEWGSAFWRAALPLDALPPVALPAASERLGPIGVQVDGADLAERLAPLYARLGEDG